MTARAIAGIVAFCIALSGVILSNILLMAMIGEVNRQRRQGDLVSYFGFSFPKLLRIWREYRQSYPSGSLHIYFVASFVVGMVGGLIVAVCLHILG